MDFAALNFSQIKKMQQVLRGHVQEVRFSPLFKTTSNKQQAPYVVHLKDKSLYLYVTVENGDRVEQLKIAELGQSVTKYSNNYKQSYKVYEVIFEQGVRTGPSLTLLFKNWRKFTIKTC